MVKFYGKPKWPVSMLRTDQFLHVNLFHAAVLSIGLPKLPTFRLRRAAGHADEPEGDLCGVRHQDVCRQDSDEPKVGDLCGVCGEPLDERDVRLCLFDHEGCL